MVNIILLTLAQLFGFVVVSAIWTVVKKTTSASQKERGELVISALVATVLIAVGLSWLALQL